MQTMNGLRHGTDAANLRRLSVATLWLALLFCLPFAAHALGFGTLTLSSHLNEELKAEVPLLLNASDDINTVRIELASPSDYRQVGLAWQPELTRIKVFIEDKHNPRPRVLLRSVGAINATMLSILLKAQKTGRGTYYKHFQLLFDPLETIGLRSPKPSVIALHAVSDSAGSSPLQQRDQGWARVWRYGPVHAGDSLSEIAYRLRRDKRFSNRQVMLSLYKQNLHGFIDGDINQLKQGAWLTVPRGEVVKQYTGKAAMRTLSMLLTRHHDDGAAVAVSSGPTPATTKPDTTTPASGSDQPLPEKKGGQELRYSGSIVLNGASAKPFTDALNTVQKNVSTQFGAMHAEMMAGKLQMAKLGKSVATINQSMQGIRQDIHALRKDVAMIKSRSESGGSDMFDNWQIIIFAMLAGLLGALLAMVLQRKPSGAPVAEVAGKQPATAAQHVDNHSQATDTDKLIANEIVQSLNQAEESLGQCEYEKAEQQLAQVEAHNPDSLRASALKAQLYHETGRHDARNKLINSISEGADKQHWENFCNLLPSHVWNACFGSNAVNATAHETVASDDEIQHQPESK